MWWLPFPCCPTGCAMPTVQWTLSSTTSWAVSLVFRTSIAYLKCTEVRKHLQHVMLDICTLKLTFQPIKTVIFSNNHALQHTYFSVIRHILLYQKFPLKSYLILVLKTRYDFRSQSALHLYHRYSVWKKQYSFRRNVS